MPELPIDDATLDRLEKLLDDPAFEQAMRLDEMQGFFCAGLAGPQPLDDDGLLAEAMGETDESGAAPERQAEVRALAARLLEGVRAQLAAGEPVLWLYPLNSDEDSPMDYGPWCMAYLHGVDVAPEDWFDRLDAEEAEFLDACLYPMMVLTGEAEAAAREHGEPWPEGEELDQLLADCEENLPDAVRDIHRFWVAKHGTGTVVRGMPKVGRNDPCPCGSGKKYKQCCGS